MADERIIADGAGVPLIRRDQIDPVGDRNGYRFPPIWHRNPRKGE
jgi:hypothetical protein